MKNRCSGPYIAHILTVGLENGTVNVPSFLTLIFFVWHPLYHPTFSVALANEKAFPDIEFAKHYLRYISPMYRHQLALKASCGAITGIKKLLLSS